MKGGVKDGEQYSIQRVTKDLDSRINLNVKLVTNGEGMKIIYIWV